MADRDSRYRRLLGTAWVPGVVALASAALLWRSRRYGLVGWDTYPAIAASRIESIRSFTDTFTEPLLETYASFRFYRPVTKLTWAWDHRLWLLDPFGYRLTNALVWAVCALNLHALVRRLLGRDGAFGAAVALVAFLASPQDGEAVVGPISRRADLLSGALIVWALARQARALERADDRWLVMPAILTALALLSKETAIVVLPSFLLLGLLFPPERPLRDRLQGAVRATTPPAIAALATLAVRFAVVHGLGGHTGAAGGTILESFTRTVESLPRMLGHVATSVLQDFQTMRATAIADPWIGALLLGALIWLVAAPLGRFDGADDARVSAGISTMAVGLTLMVGAAGLYAYVGFLVPWYLFIPGIGLAVVFGGVAHLVATMWERRGRRAVAMAIGGMLAAWLGWQACNSPVVRGDPVWSEWTRTSDAFFGRLRTRILDAAAGDVVRIEYPGSVLRPYTVQAWADLVFTPGAVRVATAPHHEGDRAATQTAGGVLVVLDGGHRVRMVPRSALPAARE